jgi:hypothetical protein
MIFISKVKRNEIVEKMKTYFQSGKLSDKSLGIMMRTFHISTPVSYLILSVLAPRYVVNIVAALLLVIFLMFIVFGGCILSMVENKICNDDFTIADPFLELLEMEKTSKNRFNISLTIFTIYNIIIAIIYYIRFTLKIELFN